MSNSHLESLDSARRTYVEEWSASAGAHSTEGDYEWLEADIAGHRKVLEIGCGAGHSTLCLLTHGHLVTVVEENPHCIAATSQRLQEAGFSVEVILRGTPVEAGISYTVKYGAIDSVGKADCVLIEGDALHDPALAHWVRGSERFDAVICWLLGVHTFRGHDAELRKREIADNFHYRILVQNEVYDLAEIALRAGGILSVADRGQTPDSKFLEESILQGHCEQASTTSLKVQHLRHKRYVAHNVRGGMKMITTAPSGERIDASTIAQSIYVVVSQKP